MSAVCQNRFCLDKGAYTHPTLAPGTDSRGMAIRRGVESLTFADYEQVDGR